MSLLSRDRISSHRLKQHVIIASFFTRDTHCADHAPRTSAFAVSPCISQTTFSAFPIHVSWEPEQSYHVKMVSKERVSLTVQLQFLCRWLLTGGTVISVSLIAVLPTVLEKSMFYEYLSVASVFLGLQIQFVNCCLVTTRAFLPASLTVTP